MIKEPENIIVIKTVEIIWYPKYSNCYNMVKTVKMKKTCTDYMYEGKWTDEFLRLNSADYYTEQSPEITELKDAVILPARESSVHAWGSGGAVDSDGQLAEASRLGTIFGEAYPYSRTELMTLNESV